MKNFVLISATLLLLTVFSCKKECSTQDYTVVRDCTGTYIRTEGKDFQVCNPEKVTAFNDGAQVTVTYIKLNECKGSANNQIVCAMYHANEGWIEVQKIQ